MSTDPFARVLGRGRGGVAGARAMEEPPTPVERARRLLATLDAHEGPLLDRLHAEQRLGAELGLEVRRGLWSPGDGDERWMLAAIYFEEQFIGFYDLGPDGRQRLLRFDDGGTR